jgi:glycosyltransferase involved in cell wall biosynthesis
MKPAQLISVVIPCYNGAKVLLRAVQSVLAQDTPGTEIIIVDDKSTDDSLSAAKSLASQFPEIQCLAQPANWGPGAARNAGLRRANGRYVCFLDADDEYAPRFFATVLPLMENDAELCWISTGVELVNAHREVHPIQLDAMIGSLPSNLIVRKAAVELLGGFPEGSLFRGPSAGEDIIFRTALDRWFHGAFRSEKFLRYRVSRGSHFDHFLDRTAVAGNELIFNKKDPDEENGALTAAGDLYRDKISDRISLLASLKTLDHTRPPFVDRLFKALSVFDESRARFDAVEGPLHSQEGYALYHFAKYAPGQGLIVEIGSHFGRSTCWLAAGTRAAGREKVVTVDHFRGTPERRKAGSNPPRGGAEAGTTLPAFLANLEKLGLRNWVDARVGSSTDVGSKWQGAIRLLFINGDHSYEATRFDTETWSKYLVPGGIMIFHDVHVWPGLTEFYRELLRISHLWKEVCKIRSMRMVQRLP